MTSNRIHIASEKTKKVILIGTSHEYQKRHISPKVNEIEQFKTMLHKLCSLNSVRLIAEEMHEEALAEDGSTSVAQELARELNVKHDFSEMSLKERGEAGVIYNIHVTAWREKWTEQEKGSKERESHAIRERYWLSKLGSLDLWPALFICGTDHTQYFSALLRNEGIDVIVPFSDWSPTATGS